MLTAVLTENMLARGPINLLERGKTAVVDQLALGSRPLSEAHRQSLEELYSAHFSAVLRHCQRLLGNPDDAADAAQEVFLRAIQSAPRDRASGEMRPWLLLVARNYCLDLLRRRKRLDGIVRSGNGALEQSADPEGTTITRHTVAAVLGGLRLRERQALWQSAVEGDSPAGIARQLGLSYMAAAQLLHRARRHALLAAARVAALLYILRRAWPRGYAVGRVVALASVPLLAVSTTSTTLAVRTASSPVVAASAVPAHATPVANSAHAGEAVLSTGQATGAAAPAPGPVHSVAAPLLSRARDAVQTVTAIPSCLPTVSQGTDTAMTLPGAIATTGSCVVGR